MLGSEAYGAQAQPSITVQHDVRYICAVPGRYGLSRHKSDPQGKIAIYACRLRSISTRNAVMTGPVTGKRGDMVVAHFDQFGIMRGQISRLLPSGFTLDLRLDDIERDKLGAKISWHKRHALGALPERRAHKRMIPREPRTVITLADGRQVPCFVIDISQSGVAVSAEVWPEIGTPMAVGKLVGRVVRYLEVGFALQFLAVQDPDKLESLMAPPVRQ
ncbi:MAG: PilZ domain-containing protein [Candidatus Devosia phytovorans]|uniref:PilZ domain-containing protein n=1 Tax=Candidatus Devosia phytovorans TaxID=3121372 RepID=A0AAJ5VZ70_9HYPH|nr:PilZ domain-containing protein [Devosia sp.]WEK06139.1 MAG: PilZ domain-containing protein [Devosia sp.]